jgi:Domain of unknown function (DUF4136)
MARRTAPRRIAAALAAAILAVIAGVECIHEPSLEERTTQQIVVTKFDPDANFASYATFAMPDSIVLRRSLDPLDSLDAAVAAPENLDPAIANPMLDEISAQLTSRGYTRVARTQGPDLGVVVTAVELVRVEQVSYGAWWNVGTAAPSYWGYNGAIFASPVAYETIAWQTGTVVVELADLRGPRDAALAVPNVTVDAGLSGAEIRVVWAAIIHGVIRQDTTAPPIDSLRQAFAQSPYLRR